MYILNVKVNLQSITIFIFEATMINSALIAKICITILMIVITRHILSLLVRLYAL